MRFLILLAVLVGAAFSAVEDPQPRLTELSGDPAARAVYMRDWLKRADLTGKPFQKADVRKMTGKEQQAYTEAKTANAYFAEARRIRDGKDKPGTAHVDNETLEPAAIQAILAAQPR